MKDISNNIGLTKSNGRLSNPNDYQDKGNDWYEYYDNKRRHEILSILRKHPEIIKEHEENPLGYRKHHSLLLQRVLNYFRMQPVLGKYFIYSDDYWKEYRIAVNVELGQRPKILEEPVFDSEEEAMHAVFLKRIEDLEKLTTRS
ncbi:hypothetical protein ACFSCZ_04285 [Siminovitchia sediminis]|uniref:N,N-dimethylformamidase alpha subunit domain-containing protein n=2 Tax=Siminovitchia sediminis TaxID=1274353 RepID=A0ABW4KGR9_9BACI